MESLDSLAPASVQNYHTALSSLWSWAVAEELVEEHVARKVRAPRPDRREIVPLSEEDVRAMLGACDRSAAYSRPGKQRSDHGRPTAARDRAIILLLVDTGIRASELCELRIYQCDLKNHRVMVMGKGRKERVLPMSPRTAQTVWRYLTTREDAEQKARPLFATASGRPLDRDALRRMLKRCGRRGGIRGVTVHRFRHTFAIWFLRNGGNVFALQRMLGHSTMEMVRRYLAIAETDVEKAHRDASPVANWVL